MTMIEKITPKKEARGSEYRIPVTFNEDTDVLGEHHSLPETELSLVRFRNLRSYLDQMDRMTDPMLGYTTRWALGGVSIKDTMSNLREGKAPSEDIEKAYRLRRKELEVDMACLKESQVIRSARRKRVRSWAGGTVNVQRYLASVNNNAPAPVFDRMSKRHQTPIIKMGINYCLSCGNGPEDFARIIASATAIVELLTVKGYGVQVDACGMTHVDHKGNAQQGVIIPLKRADEPVNVGKFLSLSHAGFMRNYWFRARQTYFGRLDSEGFSIDTSEDVVQYLGYNLMIGKTWSQGSQAQTIIGEVQKMLDRSAH